MMTGFEIQDDTGRWHPATPEDVMPSSDGLWRRIRVAEPSSLAKRYWLVRRVRHWIQSLYLIVWFARATMSARWRRYFAGSASEGDRN